MEHPRLVFGPEDLPRLRKKISQEPFASMKSVLEDYLVDCNLHESIDISYDQTLRAQVEAFLYLLTDDEDHAKNARELVLKALCNTSYGWANPSAKGLASYWLGSKIALAFDWCRMSPVWDGGFAERVSQALHAMGEMILDHGGAEQNSSPASNWQGIRGAAGGLCLLASNHPCKWGQMEKAFALVKRYLDTNLGAGTDTSGWNTEGLGYHCYAVGNFIGPYGIAIARHSPKYSLRRHVGLQRSMWSALATHHVGLNVSGCCGIKPDWCVDNPGTSTQGILGLAFYYLPDELLPAARWAYDRFVGARSVNDPSWDKYRGGTIWSILFYPEHVESSDPAHCRLVKSLRQDAGSDGIGLFTFRNQFRYCPAQDIVAQFYARTRHAGGHSAPDGLGFRITGQRTAWILGGGRRNPGKKIGQPTLYKSFPKDVTVQENNDAMGEILWSEMSADGGGFVSATMETSNTGVKNHTRRFLANFEQEKNGAQALFIVADTSSDGSYWHAPTYFGNRIEEDYGGFTIISPSGATLRGVVLHPPKVKIYHGFQDRGSSFVLENGQEISRNRYVGVSHEGGDFLLVLTIQAHGMPHPEPVRVAGDVGDAIVRIGRATYHMKSPLAGIVQP